MQKVRILFWGDAVVSTGFSRVLHSITKFLPSDKFDISWIGVNYYGDPHEYPYRIYPASLKGDIYGLNRMEEILTRENPEVIFLLNDAWIINPILTKLKEFYKARPKPRVITYVPVDAEEHDSEWYQNFDFVDKVVAYTEFGKKEILKAREDLRDKITVIPHGIDSSQFFKFDLPKSEAKKLVFPDNPEFTEGFVILNANRNQTRKRIDLTLEGFKLFAENKPNNVKLYLHMGIVDSHIHLQKYSRRIGVEKRIIVTSLHAGVQNVPIQRLNQIYNACDVGINTGLGEGFGLTNIEHAITGAPQVLADHSALKELYWDCGLMIPTTLPYTLDGIMTRGYLVKAEDVAQKLELLYTNKVLYDDLAKRGLEKFTSPEYSWKAITARFEKLIEELL